MQVDPIKISKNPGRKIKLIVSMIIALPISIVLALFGFSAFTASRSHIWEHFKTLSIADFFVGLIVWMIIFTSLFYFIASRKKIKKQNK